MSANPTHPRRTLADFERDQAWQRLLQVLHQTTTPYLESLADAIEETWQTRPDLRQPYRLHLADAEADPAPAPAPSRPAVAALIQVAESCSDGYLEALADRMQRRLQKCPELRRPGELRLVGARRGA